MKENKSENVSKDLKSLNFDQLDNLLKEEEKKFSRAKGRHKTLSFFGRVAFNMTVIETVYTIIEAVRKNDQAFKLTAIIAGVCAGITTLIYGGCKGLKKIADKNEEQVDAIKAEINIKEAKRLMKNIQIVYNMN